MLGKRRFFFKWIAIVIVYLCVFALSYEYGTRRRKSSKEEVTTEPTQLSIQRLFIDHPEYLNSSVVLKMIETEFKYPLTFDSATTINRSSVTRQGLVVFYDYSYHHLLFQQFLWLHSSWHQLREHSSVRNDLIVFISSSTIPSDFERLRNLTRRANHKKNKLILYSCFTLIDSIVNGNYEFLPHFSPHFHMELTRLFYWQQTRLSSLVIFLVDEYRNKLLQYDYIFRLDIDSFLMSNFAKYQQTSSLILGEAISYDHYTLNRLERIQNYFQSTSKSKIVKQAMTISWFTRLDFLHQLSRRIILMAVWLMKEEFTESERIHHLTYLNYPSWFIDGIFEYAAAIVLSLNHFEKFYQRTFEQFDCQHLLSHCLHISLRDPSHHLHLSKHSLHLLTTINQSNFTSNELYIYRTVIKANGLFRLGFNLSK